MKKTWVSLIAVLLAVVGTSASAEASPATTIRTIEVRAEYTEPITMVDVASCRGIGLVSPPDCRAALAGPSTFSGTISGEAMFSGTFPNPDGDDYEGVDIFERARIKGCGKGGFVLDLDDGRIRWGETDRDTFATPASNTWAVRRGSGTGGLTGLISGSGMNHWHMYWSETGTQTWGRGVFTGTITCEVPRPTTRSARSRHEARPPRESSPAAVRSGPATDDIALTSHEAADARLATGSLPATGEEKTSIAAGALIAPAAMLSRRWLRRGATRGRPAPSGSSRRAC